VAVIPEKFVDLLRRDEAFAHLAFVMPDGTPRVTPVWFDYEDGIIRVNTTRGTLKGRTFREGTRVALSVMDPNNPYRYIQIRGRVRRVTEQGADAHIDAMSKKYLDISPYPYREPGSVHVIFEIEPQSAQTMG